MDSSNTFGKETIFLTPAQLEAVNSQERFLAVVAGPGSGKTRVLTERIFHLINNCGVDYKNILAVSFSNKAAGEVAKRLRKSLGNRVVEMGISTFHSFGLTMIRNNASRLGFKENIEILTPTDRNHIIRKMWDDQRKKGHPCSFTIEEMIFNISMYKGGTATVSPEIISYCEKYNEELKSANCIDFDDMILLARKLLMENEDIRKSYQDQYSHVMVDEVQDMNKYQTDIIQLLIGPTTSLFIVGDDDQCIYEWRGAMPDFLKNLAKDDNYHIIHLDDNFRSEGAIVRASSSFIQRNMNRIRKNLQAKKHSQLPASKATTYAYQFSGPANEASFIAKTINKLVADSMYQYSDFTVLVRKHSQERPIAEALSKLKIPYHIQSDDVSQYDEFISFLKAFAYMESKNNLSRAMNFPTRIVDNFTYEDLIDEYPLIRAMSIPDAFKWLHENNCQFEDSELFHLRYEFLISLSRNVPKMSITDLVNAIHHHYTEEEKTSTKIKEKLENIKAILPIAKDYDTIQQGMNKDTSNKLIRFLDCLSLSSQDESSEITDENTVNILTCHRSKGLEFPVVFIPGVQVSQNKEMSPYSFINGYYTNSENLLEAERRLFYVAMTRAIDRLYITCSSDPYSGNSTIIKRGFLAEIPEIVISSENERSYETQQQQVRDTSAQDDYSDIDYEDINDIASSEGFVIDDDGHWVPIESKPGYEDF